MWWLLNVISNRDQISDIIVEITKPSILSLDESYYKDLDFVHCIIHIENINICILDELLLIDESLLINTSRIIINIISGLELKISEIESITNIIYTKTNYIDYYINLYFDVKESSNHIDLLIFFVQ